MELNMKIADNTIIINILDAVQHIFTTLSDANAGLIGKVKVLLNTILGKLLELCKDYAFSDSLTQFPQDRLDNITLFASQSDKLPNITKIFEYLKIAYSNSPRIKNHKVVFCDEQGGGGINNILYNPFLQKFINNANASYTVPKDTPKLYHNTKNGVDELWAVLNSKYVVIVSNEPKTKPTINFGEFVSDGGKTKLKTHTLITKEVSELIWV
jgi:hypothetical protein